MSNHVMGLDLSTKTGVVVLGQQQSVLHSDVWTVPHPEEEGVSRAEVLGKTVMEFANHKAVRLVVIEGYAYAKAHSQVLMVELGTMVRHYLRRAGPRYIIVPPSRLKQFVAGKGNVKKELMILNVYKSWGFETDSADIADAYGLARLGRYAMGYAPGDLANEPKWRRDIVDKVIHTCGLDKL